jgi:hypothetical protein
MATSKDHDHVLPNGNTFLASTASLQGHWAKATDPITAIKEVRRREKSNWPKGKVPIAVWYGDAETLHVNDYGGITWAKGKPYVPIGLFTATERSINPLKKADFEEGRNHEDWMKDECSVLPAKKMLDTHVIEKDPAVQELIAESN